MKLPKVQLVDRYRKEEKGRDREMSEMKVGLFDPGFNSESERIEKRDMSVEGRERERKSSDHIAFIYSS